MEALHAFARLSNIDLAAEVIRLAGCERASTVELVASLAEFDRRRLYLDHGFKSLFTYCFHELHLSEHAAYGRIEAARAAQKFPCVLRLLVDGRLSLTNLCLLSRHLTPANHLALLEEAAYKRQEDVQRIVARLAPKPDAPSLVRKLPDRPCDAAATSPALAMPSVGASPADAGSLPSVASPSTITKGGAALTTADRRPSVLAPLAPDRYKLQVTIDEDTRGVLRQAQDLMRHSLPSGDPAVIVARALRLLVDDLLKKKTGRTGRPRAAGRVADGSRTIPAAVKREVWKRDLGRCTFEGVRGRCNARSPLEYHHVIPFAKGGPATAANIELRCRAHNAHQASLDGLPWEGRS